jgi:hypothetical protein
MKRKQGYYIQVNKEASLTFSTHTISICTWTRKGGLPFIWTRAPRLPPPPSPAPKTFSYGSEAVSMSAANIHSGPLCPLWHFKLKVFMVLSTEHSLLLVVWKPEMEVWCLLQALHWTWSSSPVDGTGWPAGFWDPLSSSWAKSSLSVALPVFTKKS